MSDKQQENIFRSVGAPRNDDRFTVVLSANYLEWETGAVTDVRWAYDKLIPSERGTCYQQAIRIHPGRKTEIIIPNLDWGKFELLLGHKMPQLPTAGDAAELLKEQQLLNEIEIWDAERRVGTIACDKMMFGQFDGPLFATATRATTLLHITAAPN